MEIKQNRSHTHFSSHNSSHTDTLNTTTTYVNEVILWKELTNVIILYTFRLLVSNLSYRCNGNHDECQL